MGFRIYPRTTRTRVSPSKLCCPYVLHPGRVFGYGIGPALLVQCTDHDPDCLPIVYSAYLFMEFNRLYIVASFVLGVSADLATEIREQLGQDTVQQVMDIVERCTSSS